MKASLATLPLLCATLICSMHALADEPTSNTIPKYYVGTFQDYVPGLIGQTVPNVYIWVKCSDQGACSVKTGGSTINNFNSSAIWERLPIPNAALTYAREHKVVKPGSAMTWYAQNLKPLLDSNASINHCISIQSTTMNIPPGYLLLCRLDKNPWEKDVVLFMGMLLANCGELFCGYEIYPMFRQDK